MQLAQRAARDRPLQLIGINEVSVAAPAPKEQVRGPQGSACGGRSTGAGGWSSGWRAASPATHMLAAQAER